MLYLKCFLLSLLSLAFISCASTPKNPKTLEDYQKVSKAMGGQLALPPFERTPDSITAAVDLAISEAEASLDAVGRLSPDAVTFENTLAALDTISYQAMLVGSRIYLMKETHPDAAVRDAATEAIKKMQAWSVGLDYREDVYAAVKAFADTNPQLEGEHQKLFEETLRDYRRAGLHLPKAQRDEVEALRKELANLTTDFRTNITKEQETLTFTQEQLKGAPESLLTQIKNEDGTYDVQANVTFHYLAVMRNVEVAETRRQVLEARYSLAQEENAPLIQQIVELRDTIAHKLGYDTWADFKTEVKMVKTGERAKAFVADLAAGLQPKLDAELETFRRLKAEHTGNPNATLELWDWRYYENELKKTRYSVDVEQLRVYFPYPQVLSGMFDVYAHCFDLKFVEVEPDYKWVEDLKLYLVLDAQSGEPLGAVYFDMFPREGKYNHFAQFGIVDGKRLDNGLYRRPVVAMICNFPPAEEGKPSLLSHNEVETLFHEFGHVLHSVLTRAHYARFAGTSVPRDFVEAPSQMLENWCWDKTVLDRFAADYRDSQKKIPAEILEQMEAAKKATIATFYRRQLAFGMLDLQLHSEVRAGAGTDVIAMSNDTLSEVFLNVPEGSSFVTYFGHLMGYDAGYYGYAWSDAISADMATVFEHAPDRYLDKDAGMRLRREIYEPGGSRDVDISIEKFLGRERSLKPFLDELGVQQ